VMEQEERSPTGCCIIQNSMILRGITCTSSMVQPRRLRSSACHSRHVVLWPHSVRLVFLAIKLDAVDCQYRTDLRRFLWYELLGRSLETFITVQDHRVHPDDDDAEIYRTEDITAHIQHHREPMIFCGKCLVFNDPLPHVKMF
jgi:hypothetical protein